MAYDNLSSIPQWLSDALCRLSTGGGMSKRTLYTDGDEFVLDAQRPVLLNGIEEVATRPDLLSRSLLVEAPVIPEASRIDEEVFWADFAQAQTGILGGLLDVLVVALARVGDVKLERMPRMADLAKWVTAAEPALGWATGSFLKAYKANRDEGHETAVETSVIGAALRRVADHGFSGTASELLEKLAGKVDEKATKAKDWPKTARAVRGELDRLAPNLRELGYVIDHAGPSRRGAG